MTLRIAWGSQSELIFGSTRCVFLRTQEKVKWSEGDYASGNDAQCSELG